MLAAGLIGAAGAAVDVTDDQGQNIRLAQPARRIVSLAPHVTELLYAAGAGDKVVGVVQYSDYPEAAKKVARVGGYTSVDMEKVVALKPDLVLAWKSGNRDAHLDKLRGLGIPPGGIALPARKPGRANPTTPTLSAGQKKLL